MNTGSHLPSMRELGAGVAKLLPGLELRKNFGNLLKTPWLAEAKPDIMVLRG
jgi:hypothetical protein